MKIETKFDVGQKVYRKSDGLPVKISSIRFKEYDGKIECRYFCNDIDGIISLYCREDQLTEEKPKPKSVHDLKVGDKVYSHKFGSGVIEKVYYREEIGDYVYKVSFEGGKVKDRFGEEYYAVGFIVLLAESALRKED